MARRPVKERPAAKRIAIFNHKGGVGKTTLTFNIASSIARLGKRVLLVDSDPQCNLTAYLIEGDVVDDLLDRSDDDDGQTLWSSVKPVVEAMGDVAQITPIPLPQSKLFLLPGDIRLSDFEAELQTFWAECLQRKVRGYRGTTALSWVISQVCQDEGIDYVFYDSGPNIGPLNRVILLDCDHYIIPVACDLFSVRALKTLGITLGTWISDWETISMLAPDGTYLLPGFPTMLGYIPQAFSLYRGQIASQQSRFLPLIDRAVREDVIGHLKRISKRSPGMPTKLGEVKDFNTLVSASQMEGLPLESVSVGTTEQRHTARAIFRNIARRIIDRTSQ